MYNVIQQIIGHNWVTSGAGDQQYIYYIVGAVIICAFVFVLDMLVQLVRVFRRRK